MYQYNEDYNEDAGNQDNQRREKKKKRHRKPKEEVNNDDEMYNDYNNPNMAYEEPAPPEVVNPRKSEEENFDPSQPPRRKHKSKSKKREEYVEEPNYPNDANVYNNESIGSPEPNNNDEMVNRKPKKSRKKKSRDMVDTDAQDDHYLNLNLQSPNGENQNYPFEDPSESIQLEDDDQEYQDPNHSDNQSNRNETPVEDKPKKKSGGFMKIFASFKKKNKTKNPDNKINGNQWQSNPEIFNPGYDSQPATLERKKISGRSARDLATTKAHVILLDGVEVEFSIDQKMLGKDLFDQVCVYLDLIEKDFFGMTFINSKMETWFWLEMDKKMSKQLSGGDDWMFNFQVKFYPPEPVLLQEDITRYLLSLQVRQDVFTGKLPCSWITQALLGSFMVQSELGDYDELEHGEGIEYLREFEFVQNQSDQLLEKIAELHKKHINLAPDKADVKYLETAKRLEQYGVDLHPARDNDDVEIFIGVCYQGVLIYREKIRIGRFAWPKVLRISYKKNYFYLKIRSNRYDDSVAIVGFKLFNHNLAKRLWKNAVEQHTFFRMKEPQNQKPNQRLMPSGASTYGYSGKTLHQYRSMNILRNEPLKFDRSVTKRRTIGSMPAGLDKAGMQYSSMHSLNRSHPRDMTLGKTKSIEHLSFKRPGSNLGVGQGSVSNINNRLAPPHSKYPPYGGSVSSFKDDDRHLSFQSGNSINAADSYTAINDDQVSLPPMPTLPQPEHTRPYKKHSKSSRPSDVLSDDGNYPQAGYSKPSKKPTKPQPFEENSLDDQNSQPEYAKVLKKQSSKTSRHADVLSDDGINSQPDYVKPLKKQPSRTRSKDVFPDENPQPEFSKPLKKQSSKSSRPTEELSDGENSQPIYAKPHKKKHSRSSRPNDDLSDEGFVPTIPQVKLNAKVDSSLSFPDPPMDSSHSEELDPPPKVSKKKGNHRPNSASSSNRPMPPNHFKPPPPPPEPIPQIRSNTSSERSSPMEHNLPPPPPPIIELPQVSKPKPPPVKPKPAIKPKPNIAVKDQFVVKKNIHRYEDDSSNDNDML